MSKVCLYQGRGFSNQSGPRSLYPCMKQQLIKWLRLYRVKLLSGLWLRQGCELRAQTPPFTWGLFFGVGPAMASLYKNSGGAPFVRAGTPDPSLALITADQFDNRIDCEKDFFIQFPRRPYSQWKRKYSAISYPRSERGLAKKKETPKKGEKSPTHLFPFTVFPLASPIHIWLQRLFELKKPFVCLRSYWSLINCKLVRHQVSVPSVGKARLQLLFFFFFLKGCFAHFAPATLKRNAIRVYLR